MRRLLIAAVILCAACTPPKYRKFDRFVWGANQDVLWLIIDGTLHRCWQHQSGGPVCMEALMPTHNPAIEATTVRILPQERTQQPTQPATAKPFPVPPDYTN